MNARKKLWAAQQRTKYVASQAGGTMRSGRTKRILATATMAAILTAASLSSAQEGAPRPAAKDYLQRSLEIYEFRKAAPSGASRGEEIYYYKCWFCHNEYTKDIPKLDTLFKRPTLVSGEPVTDESVRNQIRNGSANMAAYKYTLNEADLNDLVSYLKEKCCWNSDVPPLNPRYIAR
jgi:mono/diheme cytochrome c family protein